jgi:hypothetical protein
VLGASGTADSSGVFLISAGGVDGDDLPLANTRTKGRPRLAAYAYAVSPRDLSGPHSFHTLPLTGTSMASAVVSGVAATVWGYAPELTGGQVASILYDSGRVIEGVADYPRRDPIRRVNLCTALNRACKNANDKARCPSVAPVCNTGPFGNPPLGDLNPAFNVIRNHPDPSVRFETYEAFPCGPNGCPRSERSVVTYPWVIPEPDTIICKPCILSTKDGQGALYSGGFSAGLTKSYQPVFEMSVSQGYSWTTATLELVYSGGGYIQIELEGSTPGRLNYLVDLKPPLQGGWPTANVISSTVKFQVNNVEIENLVHLDRTKVLVVPATRHRFIIVLAALLTALPLLLLKVNSGRRPRPSSSPRRCPENRMR